MSDWNSLLGRLIDARRLPNAGEEGRESTTARAEREVALLEVYGRLVAISRRVVQQAPWVQLEPEDLAHEVLIRLVHPLGRRDGLVESVRAAANGGAYMWSVVKHTAVRMAMQRARSMGVPLRCRDVPTEQEAIAEESENWDAGTALSALVEALGSLDSPTRNTMLLRLAGNRLQEIADIEGLPFGTVASRLSRATRLLREHLLSSGKSHLIDAAGVASDLVEQVRRFLGKKSELP